MNQLEKLNSLLANILPANQFYAQKLPSLPHPFTSLTDFVATVPFTTKDELAADHENHPPFGTTHTFPLENYHRFHQTSGTRGKPLIWMDDEASWQWILSNWQQVWTTAGVKKADCAFFPFSFGPFLGFWAGFEAATSLGVRAVPGGGLSSEDRLKLLQRSQANVLCCTPTYALRLAEVGKQTNLPVESLGIKTILVCGEPGGSIPSIHQRIESAWQARVFDHHGMTEIGPVTISDPANPKLLRILHDSYFAEVIDPATEQAVKPNQVGELVLTTLGRPGSPLLRYRTGDLVKPVSLPNEDPAHFALEGGIIGRSDDMIVIRGINIYPSSIDAIVRQCDGIAEYQVLIDQRSALPEISLQVEASEQTAHHLTDQLRQAFGLRIPVQPVLKGSLPTFEVKANRWQILT